MPAGRLMPGDWVVASDYAIQQNNGVNDFLARVVNGPEGGLMVDVLVDHRGKHMPNSMFSKCREVVHTPHWYRVVTEAEAIRRLLAGE